MICGYRNTNLYKMLLLILVGQTLLSLLYKIPAPHPINNLSHILFVLLYYLILYWAFKIFLTDDVFSFTLKYVWKFENLQTSMLVFCVISFNTLIYRYIAIVYVYKYVWKHDKPKNGKPVRKHITFVTLPFFWDSLLFFF